MVSTIFIVYTEECYGDPQLFATLEGALQNLETRLRATKGNTDMILQKWGLDAGGQLKPIEFIDWDSLLNIDLDSLEVN